ncbi:MAG: VWA domain-containing protein [Chloroflexota bacterium]|nr:VWA domain-containing protein [Chloroflexota bacterium]
MGVAVTTGGLIELAHSLSWVGIGNKDDFRDAARCILVKRREDLAVFDEAFELFWRAWERSREGDPLEQLLRDLSRHGLGKGRKKPTASHSEGNGEAKPRPGSRTETLKSVAEEEATEGEDTIRAMYSPGEALRQKDFSFLTSDELSDARRFLSQMRWTLTRRRSLRRAPSRHGRQLDVRRSIRHSLRHGGEMLDLARRGPKLKRRPVVVLRDISGSMERYTRLLLHFLHSLESSREHVEVFLFGTRLTRITRELRKRDPDAAIAAAAGCVQDWNGGTRIGESLHTFNHRWARRVLGQGAIVIVISDGWDRGEPALLAQEMARLQRQSYRLLWLNPLLGSRDFEPLTQGIRAALPHVDDFLPVHNLASLEALASLLNEIQEGRPARASGSGILSGADERAPGLSET